MIHSSYIPTICRFSSHTNSNSQIQIQTQSPLFLKFKTTHHENLRYLKTLGVINPYTKLHKPPSPENLTQILNTVNYLKSKGFSDPDFSRLAFLVPDLFSPEFNPEDIEPVFDFLTSYLSASMEESSKLILKCPKLLESNVEYHLKPTLSYLRELGLEKLNLPTTLNAHLLNTRIDVLQEKMKFLQSVGLTYEESARVCERLRAIFGYNVEKNLTPKFMYLVREMKRNGVEELNEFPQYLAYSLERRIRPRHLHLKQRNVEVSLKKMLTWGDERFYAKWR